MNALPSDPVLLVFNEQWTSNDLLCVHAEFTLRGFYFSKRFSRLDTFNHRHALYIRFETPDVLGTWVVRHRDSGHLVTNVYDQKRLTTYLVAKVFGSIGAKDLVGSPRIVFDGRTLLFYRS